MPEPAKSDFDVDLRYAPDAAATARQFIELHADSLPAEVIADAALLVSELVTNAVRHGRPTVTLSMTLQPPLIGVSVSDGGDQMPPRDPVNPAASATGGRGLVIVDRLSSDWGVLPHDSAPGKTVWFRLNPH